MTSADPPAIDAVGVDSDSVPFVDLKAQHRSLEGELRAAIDDVMSNTNFILGAPVAEFERAFADFLGVGHAVGVSSGLDALRLTLLALGVDRGDEVVLPANTFIATALAVSSVGARPVLVDCRADTYEIDVDAIEAAVGSRTRVIMPVHLAGQSADLHPILELAASRSLDVVEDAAQSHGAVYRGGTCGSHGVAGCFSFYPAKNLGAYGDGGAVVTRDPELADRLRRLRNYGEQAKYEHTEKGYNARLDTVQAAVLNVKLPKLAGWNAARAAAAAAYRRELDGVGDLAFQALTPGSTHVYHLFIVETEYRDALQTHLRAAGIGSGIHYPSPIHLQPAYADLGYRAGDFPNAERLAKTMLSLPMYPELTGTQIERVTAEIRRFFREAA
ncbi:MAG: DegT/DnrJ/EryC1/StrS family aminotransferase [Acidimicrobiia bacterium]|nr:DegT/DnrJ/EryC1/StrS family aminotransferase [Acidimicrobiia bacterium]